jgi:hypothetical protein
VAIFNSFAIKAQGYINLIINTFKITTKHLENS